MKNEGYVKQTPKFFIYFIYFEFKISSRKGIFLNTVFLKRQTELLLVCESENDLSFILENNAFNIKEDLENDNNICTRK